jgi:CHAT domain-containing protein
MKNNTIYLEAAGEKNRLKIGIYTPSDVIWHYEDLPAPLERIDKTTESVAEALNNASRNGRGGIQEFEKLKAVGRMLCDDLLPWEIKEKLRKSDAEYLVLKLDDRLVHIPWELLCVDEQFLCQRFSMGRLVKTRQKIAESSERSLRKPLRAWILANPRGDLDIAASEGLKIFQDMARLNQEEEMIDPCLDAEITTDDVRERIKSYDFVHFAGHATYSSQADQNGPGQSGWKLADGNFTVRHIDRMASGAAMPAFVFSNACQSARTEAWEWKENSEDGSFGLANAFLRAGVKHYLGTFWEIMDEPSSHFAHEFYGLLSSGMSVGNAVRQARCNLMDMYGPDTCWASYILYGDPRIGYFSQDTPAIKPTPPEPTISRSTPTRGSLFNYNFNTGKLKEMRTWAGVLLVILVAVFGVIAGNAVVKNFSMNQDIKIRQLLTEQAEKKQKRTEELFKELAKITDLTSQEQTSDALTLAMVFDSRISLSDQKKENLAAFAIQSQLIERSRFKILERKSFDTVLQELIWDKAEQSNLLMPKLLLFLEVYDDGDHSLALMRLVDKNTGTVVDNLFEEIDNSKPVFAQKEELSENLLKRLKARYPLRGLISEIRENEVGLNIGDDDGVIPGQWFKVVGKDVFLKITSVQPDTAAAQITKGNTPLEKGLEVEAI